MMKKQIDKISFIPKTEITVFQALTLLLEKYRDVPYIYHKIASIYLTGVRNRDTESMLSNLLDDSLLENYIINTSKQSINNDHVRRYFESHLCHNTLITSLDLLDINLLEKHFESIFNRIEDDAQELLEPIIHGHVSPTKFNEYSDGLVKLNHADSYASLQPPNASGRATPQNILDERKQKLMLIVKCMYAATYVPEEMPSGERPLDIYFKPNSVYHNNHRGRIARIDLERQKDGHRTSVYQTVRPHTLGIMRSFMPLPAEDALFAKAPSTSPRPADTFTYAKGSYPIPERIFSNKVTPFVSSISGTMLIKLRVIAQLLRENKFVFNAPDASCDSKNKQLEFFLKTLIAYMIYHAGGHSLEEYLQVLELPIVQNEFRSLRGFSDLTLIHLFQQDNTEAFNRTVKQTIFYNNHILLKKKLHRELETQHNIKKMLKKSIFDHPSVVGTIGLNGPDARALYTIIDPSIIGGALLFLIIRLLNHKSVAENRQHDLSHRLKQLCFVLCLITIAHMFDAKIIKQKSSQPINNATKKPSDFILLVTRDILDYSIFQPETHLNKQQTQPLTKKINPKTSSSSLASCA